MTYKLVKTRRLGKWPNISPPAEYARKLSRSVCRYHMCMRNTAGSINTTAKEWIINVTDFIFYQPGVFSYLI
jgi:hypothetical protein